MAEKRVGNPQKLKIDLAITIQPLTLCWVEAESLYKKNTVIKLKVKVNDGADLVYRPQGERYNPQYMSTCKRSGRVSVHCWGWISHEGAGVPHRIEGQLDGLHYQHIFQNVTVPSVWMLYPEFIIHLQQDHSSIHDSSSSLRNTYHSQRTDIHATSGIRTHNLSRRGAVDRPDTGTGEVSHLLIENENEYFSP